MVCGRSSLVNWEVKLCQQLFTINLVFKKKQRKEFRLISMVKFQYETNIFMFHARLQTQL